MVSTIETPPTRSVVINNLTTSMIDNMFIEDHFRGQRAEKNREDDTNQDWHIRCRFLGI